MAYVKYCQIPPLCHSDSPYLNHNQTRLIYNSFFKGQLSYCTLIWTFCSRSSNHLISKLQERALRIAYNDFNSSFSEFLEMANESTIHIRNLKILLTEVNKFLNGLSPPIMNEVFQTNDCPYDLRNPRISANIRLDEDVLKTSFVFVFRRRLEDALKTSWSRRICSP